MASVIKKEKRELPLHHPLSRKFDTPEEGAQAKADYVLSTVLKDFDWTTFMAKKQNQTATK